MQLHKQKYYVAPPIPPGLCTDSILDIRIWLEELLSDSQMLLLIPELMLLIYLTTVRDRNTLLGGFVRFSRWPFTASMAFYSHPCLGQTINVSIIDCLTKKGWGAGALKMLWPIIMPLQLFSSVFLFFSRKWNDLQTSLQSEGCPPFPQSVSAVFDARRHFKNIRENLEWV